jgi:hypothetical protein
MAVASQDSCIYIYNADKTFKLRKKIRAPNIVMHIDYSEDSTVIQATCVGCEMMFYDIINCCQTKFSCKDLNWTTWTCPRGWPIQGIEGQETSNCTYISVDRSLACDTIATGDNKGFVKLFRHPCPKPSTLISII